LPSETPSKNISPNNWTNNNSPNDKSPRNCLPKDRILSVNSPKDNSTNDNRPNDNLPNGKWANDNSSIAEIIKSPKSLKKGRVLKPIEDLAPIQEEITILAIIRNQLEVNYNWDTDVSNEIKEIWLTIMACWKFRKKAHMEEVQKDRSTINDHYNSDNCNKSASQSARPHIQTPTDDL